MKPMYAKTFFLIMIQFVEHAWKRSRCFRINFCWRSLLDLALDPSIVSTQRAHMKLNQVKFINAPILYSFIR